VKPPTNSEHYNVNGLTYLSGRNCSPTGLIRVLQAEAKFRWAAAHPPDLLILSQESRRLCSSTVRKRTHRFPKFRSAAADASTPTNETELACDQPVVPTTRFRIELLQYSMYGEFRHRTVIVPAACAICCDPCAGNCTGRLRAATSTTELSVNIASTVIKQCPMHRELASVVL